MNRLARVLTTALAGVAALTGCTGDVGPSPEASDRETTAAPRPVAAPPESDLLLPNMRSLNAGDLQVERVPLGRRLRFAASLANLGPGPLVLEPRARRDCPAGQHFAVQRIHRDANGDGEFQRRRDTATRVRRAGCMHDHPTHDHWHFKAMAEYALRMPSSTRPRVDRNKVSFCLRDNRRVSGVPTRVRREWFGDCTRAGPQGISPGWVDVYRADLDGQALLLPRRVDGRLLCLDLTADPLDRLTETDEGDNATSIGIRVRGLEVRRVRTSQCG
jgi:hypothetical protein